MAETDNEILFLNGEFMPLSEGRIPIDDRGYQFADGIYEVVRFVNGRLFRLREHLERLERSARGIEVDLEYEPSAMAGICEDLVGRSELGEGGIYIQVTRGVMKRKHLPPCNGERPTTLAYPLAIHRADPDSWEAGSRAISREDDRWGHCDLKTIALLPNVLGKIEANRRGAGEVIYYGPGNVVYEAGSANVFAVIGGEVFTHPPGPKILNGVTRMAILEICGREGIPTHETPRPLSDFLGADEVFVTSSSRDVYPIVAIDDSAIGDGRPGPISRRLLGLLYRLMEPEVS